MLSLIKEGCYYFGYSYHYFSKTYDSQRKQQGLRSEHVSGPMCNVLPAWGDRMGEKQKPKIPVEM